MRNGFTYPPDAMDSTNKYQLALLELMETLLERAFQSRAEASNAPSEFADGRNMGYVEVISVAARIADQFEIPRSEFNLPPDPENDLLGSPKTT